MKENEKRLALFAVLVLALISGLIFGQRFPSEVGSSPPVG